MATPTTTAGQPIDLLAALQDSVTAAIKARHDGLTYTCVECGGPHPSTVCRTIDRVIEGIHTQVARLDNQREDPRIEQAENVRDFGE